jgi:cytochrome P450
VFLAASLHPYLLKRAHEELDAVVGSSRLPTFDDRPHLPFIEAFMTECFRYGTPAANGFPHKVTEDDVYNGYFIEKGTIIFPNFRRI